MRLSPALRPYGIALLAAVLALLLTLLVDNPLTAPNTLLIFLGGVMCSSWYGGFGPGVLATTLTSAAAGYFYLPPPFSLRIDDPTEIVRLAEYVAVCLLISALNELRLRGQKRAEAAKAEMESAIRVKEAFLAMVSHELRTPLTAIIGWTQILRTRTADPALSAQAVATIEHNAKTEARLIEDLLDVSRLDTGQMRLESHPLDVAEVVRAAIDTVRPAIEAKGIALQTIVPSHVVFVTGDAQRLQQVFWNLLSNAVRFTPEGGRIDVQLHRIRSHARVRIRDTGRGIAPAFLPNVFERFVHGGTAETKRHDGLGLGLSIARDLVELHGGTIRVESDGLGRGAVFTVELPIATHDSGAVIAA